ncbi:MAG TPA: hypothetical protein VJT73_05780 [Polyangiaceae bacterium]|nr:hypothetical protein [Polyangiaceae bacterium]
MSVSLDADRCEALVVKAIEGDAKARKHLVELLWPAWIDMVKRSRSMGPLAQSIDHVHNVVAELVEKIGRPDHRVLRKYLEWRRAHADKTFVDWMRIVTTNEIRDYARAQRGAPQKSSGKLSAKQLLNELAVRAPDELGIRPSFTADQTARQVLAFAASHLAPDQLDAMRRWLEGAEFDEIGMSMATSEGAARKLVRAAVAVLRRRFGLPES